MTTREINSISRNLEREGEKTNPIIEKSKHELFVLVMKQLDLVYFRLRPEELINDGDSSIYSRRVKTGRLEGLSGVALDHLGTLSKYLILRVVYALDFRILEIVNKGTERSISFYFDEVNQTLTPQKGSRDERGGWIKVEAPDIPFSDALVIVGKGISKALISRPYSS